MFDVRARIAHAIPIILGCSAAVMSLTAMATEPMNDIQSQSEQAVFFESRIRPLLVNQCYACHSADTKPAGGLRVDDFNGLLAGGNGGAGVVPGDAASSTLFKRITIKNAKRRMPQDGDALSEQQIADIKQWIDSGAYWPPETLDPSSSQSAEWYEELRRKHWAFQPVATPVVPQPQAPQWAYNDIDQFLQHKREEHSLQPTTDADRTTLIRRVTFDLTGLPPTPSEIDLFVHDNDANAFEKVVDRLLASTAYGERWGRHWLDVARYAESTGPSRNIPYPHAWRYRDYVIDAVNADVPYDRFIQEQIAGDLLPSESDDQFNRQTIATGFLALGVKDVNQRFKVRFDMDNVDEQIDVISRSVLGLTVSCARCHDHKFDPIPTSDYYALAGIFTSTLNAAGVRNQMGGGGLAYYVPKDLAKLKIHLPAPPAELVADLTAKAEEAKAAFEAIRGTPEGLAVQANGQPLQRKFRNEADRLQNELNRLTDPALHGGAVHGVRDAEKIADTQIRVRGEAEKLGETVARGYLTAFSVPGSVPPSSHQSGRLELAQWLTSTTNPLTARVAVNRIWQKLFGQGLVSTVDNFGLTGNAPSHPELLDYLAQQFIANGWSQKQFIKSLVLSRTYQLSSESTADHSQQDPDNRWLWRHTPRRLTAEEMRDAMLASSGQISLSRPSGSAVQTLAMREIRDNGNEAKAVQEFASRSTSRSVYLPLMRGIIPRSIEAFDPVEQTLVTGNRDETTVPSQALYLLNSTFVRQQALSLAKDLNRQPSSISLADIHPRVDDLYRRTLGRGASNDEVVEALQFLKDYTATIENGEMEYTRELEQQTSLALASLAKATPSAGEPPLDPDQETQDGDPIIEQVVWTSDTQEHAWFAYIQAIYASADFRYVY